MPNTCSVLGCSSNSAKNTKLKFYKFPDREYEQERKEKWIKAVNRPPVNGVPWKPSKSALICSQHFVSGKKSFEEKNVDYIPSIFPRVSRKLRLEIAFKNRTRLQGRNIKLRAIADPPKAKPHFEQQVLANVKIKSETEDSADIQSLLDQVSSNVNVKSETEDNADIQSLLDQDFQPQEDYFYIAKAAVPYAGEEEEEESNKSGARSKEPMDSKAKYFSENKALRRQIVGLQCKLSQIERENSNLLNVLEKLFTPDQIEALRSKTNRAREWSDSTIAHALRFRLSCGSEGYKDLVKFGFPLPPLQILEKRLRES